MQQKIDKETAINEIKGWLDYFGEPVDLEQIEDSAVLRAVMQGRVTFDENGETFGYALMKPIEKENGEQIENVTLEEPTAEYRLRKQTMRVKAQGRNGGEGELNVEGLGPFLQAATGLSVNMLGRMKNRDFEVLQELAGFFG